jgi:hypothetical protein
MTRKTVTLALILMLLLGLFVSPVSAAPTSYESAIQLVNLEAVTANVTLQFYNADGSVNVSVGTTIPANSSVTFYPLSDENLPGTGAPPAGFDGSAVVSSDRLIASISNVHGFQGTTPRVYNASFSAMAGGTNTVTIPTLMKANFGYNTHYKVQNAGGVATNVSVAYSDGTTAAFNNLLPGASIKFDQATEAHTPKIFSGVVTSSASPIVVTVLEVGTTTLFAFNGVNVTSPTLVYPLVNANNFGYFTSILVRNVSATTSSNVTISYTPSIAGTACTETRTIAPNSDVIFAENVFTFPGQRTSTLVSTTCTAGTRFVGSGQITTNSGNVQLASVVNQLNPNGNKGAAYNALNPADGQQKVVFPLIMDRNFDFWTSWSLTNVGSAQIAAGAVTCTVVGKDISGATVNVTVQNTAAIPVGQGWVKDNINTIGNRFIGSASCVGPAGARLVGMVNEVNTVGSFDTFLVYEGIPVAVP